MRLPRSKYYRMKEWKDRRKEFLAINPYCEICGANATEVHHDFDCDYYYWTDEDFFDVEKWMALCKQCHSKITQENRKLREQKLKKSYSSSDLSSESLSKHP